MKYAINIPYDFDRPQEESEHFLSTLLESLLILLKERGYSIPSLMGQKITPELLEELLSHKVYK